MPDVRESYVAVVNQGKFVNLIKIIMFLFLTLNTPIEELQRSFSDRYPFLKLEFYKPGHASQDPVVKKHLQHSLNLRVAGLKKDSVINIHDDLKVLELESVLRDLGLNAQVSRRSGAMWLETTMTDNWSLLKQNEHGKEITLLAVNRSTGSDTETGKI